LQFEFGQIREGEMKSWMRLAAHSFGYEIRKAPLPRHKSVSVFDLAIHHLVATRKSNLTFIEVGANDGRDSLHEYIVRYSLKGVLIEPQPDVFEKLKATYAGHDDGLLFENLAISGHPGLIPIYRLPTNHLKSGDYAATVASSNRKITANQVHVRSRDLEKILVPTARLDDIVRKYCLTDLDILQLDTEGFDWEVIQTLDLKITRPRLIQFEHGHLSPKVIGRMSKHLDVHGYDLHYGGHDSDSVALRKDFLNT